MDKVRTLRSVERSKIMDGLNIHETKLYLILLANSRDNGDGNIWFRTINGVLGEEFSMERLNAACRKLVEYGLIEVLPSSLEQIKGNDFKLVYKIFPVKQRAAILKDEKGGAI